MDPSSVFTLFVSLPSEIRIKIWRCSFPEPRVVPVRFHRSSGQYASNSAPPTLLHVNSESRSICLSTYTRLIISPKYESAVFVNFDIDTIFFDNLDCSPDGDLSLDLAKSPHRNKILSCAIDSQVWEVLRVFKYDSLSEVRMMPNLRTIALVIVRASATPFTTNRSREAVILCFSVFEKVFLDQSRVGDQPVAMSFQIQ